MNDAAHASPHFDESILAPWQKDAVDAWVASGSEGRYRGTLEIFTGGGKTLMALAAFARVLSEEPGARLAVVVPTEALARQWRDSVEKWLSIAPREIGLLGAGGQDDLVGRRVLVAVLNSAAAKLPDLAAKESVQPLMLVVDECHRAGAPSFSRVFRTRAPYRLGLSATPDREELTEEGEPLEYDEQIVGRELGAVVYRFSLREAREAGWLPDYVIHHHGVRLTKAERQEYEQVSRKVTELGDRLKDLGVQTGQARMVAASQKDAGEVARAYVAAVSARKDLLYRASERSRVAARIVGAALDREESPPRILLFHERVAEAVELHRALAASHGGDRIALEHSKLSDSLRKGALARFRTGEVSALVSVKSLVEGIDVPDADVGVSVASSSSVRQRIQSLGRVLRRQFSGEQKRAEMHVVYAADTVDELIYAKEDWSDLTGPDANRYWLWPLEPDLPPLAQDGPPASPRPTEEMEWERLGGKAPDRPVRWEGVLPEREYSVDTRGTVRNQSGAVITNPQGVADMVAEVRGRPGGRFRVTPQHHLVIVFGEGEGDSMVPYVVGQLQEPFGLLDAEPTTTEEQVDAAVLEPGGPYPGPRDKAGGTFKVRQKRGGVIERKQGSVLEFALTEGGEDAQRESNAKRLLSAWQSLGLPGMSFFVNELGHAWYLDQGEPRFLADVPKGFTWPSEQRPSAP